MNLPQSMQLGDFEMRSTSAEGLPIASSSGKLQLSGLNRVLKTKTEKTGADDGNRTRDLIFTKDLLCH